MAPPTPFSLTQEQLLAVARRALGPYAEQLEAAGTGGWEILRANAAMFARISLAIGRWELEASPSTATGPARATVAVTFNRPTFAAGAVTVKAGTLVRARTSGAVFKTLTDAVFGASALGPVTVTAEAVGASEEWNVMGQYVAPSGDVLRGEIDTIDLALLDPPLGDQSITVENIPSAEGGRVGFLDIHGASVLVERTPGEADEHYAPRVMAVADAISPNAVRRQIRRFFDGIGYTEADWYLVETWEHRFAAVYDAPLASFTYYPDYDPSLFAFDDPRDASPIRNRWLDMPNAEAAAILEFKDLCSVREHGFAMDDPANTQAGLVTALGSRATPAFDLDDNVVTARHCCYDGGDFEREKILLRLSDLTRNITALGVNVTFVARGD
jgi:hypothetical protein